MATDNTYPTNRIQLHQDGSIDVPSGVTMAVEGTLSVTGTFSAGGAMTVPSGGTLTIGAANLIMTPTPTITAYAGGGQANATALTTLVNRISTVATAGDSVKLPASVPGLEIIVINRGANPCQVFGTGTDTINGNGATVGVSQGINTCAYYVCSVAGNWEVPITALQSTSPSLLSASGAIPPHSGHTYVVTKAGIAALTLAAPTAGVDDGIEITITSNTAYAHTLTATGLLGTGTASVNVATFAAQLGAGLTLMAYGGKWLVQASVGITFS